MRQKVAKKLKREVAVKMYAGDDVTEAEVLANRKEIYANADFKPVYRSRKKNYNKTTVNPKSFQSELVYDDKLKKMFVVRKKKEAYRKEQLKKRRQ